MRFDDDAVVRGVAPAHGYGNGDLPVAQGLEYEGIPFRATPHGYLQFPETIGFEDVHT